MAGFFDSFTGDVKLGGTPTKDDEPSRLAQLLRSVARGAPQAVTGLVDLAALPLTATGMIEPKNVFGSTDYLTDKGLLPKPQGGLVNQTAEVLAGGLMPLSPAALRQTAAGLRSLAPKAGEMAEDFMRKTGGLADVVPVGPNKVPSNEILFPGRSLSSLSGPEKSALTRFDKELTNDAAMRREIMRLEGGGTQEKRITPLVNKTIYQPEDLLGKEIAFFGGDQTRAGVQFDAINGVPLSKSVVAQGGDEYPFLKPNYDSNTGWASNIGPATGHLENMNKAFERADGARDVVAIKNSMNPDGADFSHPVAQALVRQLEVLNPSKEAVAMVDEMIRNTPNAKGKVGDYKGFAGLRSGDIEEQMMNGIPGMASGGDLRKAIAYQMRSAKARREGFPIYEDVLDAMLIPELRNQTTGQAGNVIFSPKYMDELNANPDYVHESYSHGIPRQEGGMIGGLAEPVPTRILAHKTYDAKIREGRLPHQAARSMQTSSWSEKFDEQSLEKTLEYLKERKRLLEQE